MKGGGDEHEEEFETEDVFGHGYFFDKKNRTVFLAPDAEGYVYVNTNVNSE